MDEECISQRGIRLQQERETTEELFHGRATVFMRLCSMQFQMNKPPLPRNPPHSVRTPGTGAQENQPQQYQLQAPAVSSMEERRAANGPNISHAAPGAQQQPARQREPTQVALRTRTCASLKWSMANHSEWCTSALLLPLNMVSLAADGAVSRASMTSAVPSGNLQRGPGSEVHCHFQLTTLPM